MADRTYHSQKYTPLQKASQRIMDTKTNELTRQRAVLRHLELQIWLIGTLSAVGDFGK
jgi:hypothetical protein